MDTDSEIGQLRKRHHDLADHLQTHALKIALLEQSMKSLVGATSRQLESATDLLTVKLETVKEDLKAIQDSQTWIVRLIIGAVAIALIALVVQLKGTP